MIVKQLSTELGAEIDQVNLYDINQENLDAVKKILIDKKFLIFRNQQFPLSGLPLITKKFGRLYIHKNEEKYLNNKYIGLVKSDRYDIYPDGYEWHIEKFYDENLPRLSFLTLFEIPKNGGETLLCDMFKIYHDLSNEDKNFLEMQSTSNCPHFNKNIRSSIHPAISTHPETQKKFLNICYSFTQTVTNIDQQKLRQLKEMSNESKYHCTVKWNLNTILVWDNRGLQHKALANYYPEKRLGIRTLTHDFI